MDKEDLVARSQALYIPLVAIATATLRHSIQKLPIATMHNPQRVCGLAQRVGYTGNQDKDLAVYRLKVKQDEGFPTVTLPGFYVIENGVFVDYEQWCQNREVMQRQ